MTEIIAFFQDLPMPPSVNHLYRQAGRKRVKSKHMLDFENQMHRWGMKHIKTLRSIHDNITKSENKLLSLRLDFYFPKSKIFTKTGAVKKLDVSNRIKAMEDVFFDLIGIDDRFVFNVTAEKLLGDVEKSNVSLYFIV